MAAEVHAIANERTFPRLIKPFEIYKGTILFQLDRRHRLTDVRASQIIFGRDMTDDTTPETWYYGDIEPRLKSKTKRRA